MEAIKLFQILSEMGMPVTNTAFPPTEENIYPPYIIFKREEIDSFPADDKVYHYEEGYEIQLYTAEKDSAKEKELINLLTDHGIVWEYVNDTRIQDGLYYFVLSV